MSPMKYVLTTERCEIADGSPIECDGPTFFDYQEEEGVTLNICAAHLFANRDYWMRKAEAHGLDADAQEQTGAIRDAEIWGLNQRITSLNVLCVNADNALAVADKLADLMALKVTSTNEGHTAITDTDAYGYVLAYRHFRKRAVDSKQ